MVLNNAPPVLEQCHVKFLLKEKKTIGWMAKTWYTYRFAWQTYFKSEMVMMGYCYCCSYTKMGQDNGRRMKLAWGHV
jgi:hypothetical protein